jgi:exodeoxyribonuclease V gamma subunit
VLHTHRSERTDALVAMLARLLGDPLDDPMAKEVVSVPTRGIERWLTQQLSAHLGVSAGQQDGVCANVDFPFPGTLVSGALARAIDTDPGLDPWLPQRAVWPLIEVVEEHFDEPWLAPLAQHIKKSATEEDGTRRFSSIRHMADLFDRYAVHRPDMLQRWAAGSPQLDEVSWQVELWRLLRERIGTPSPAERLRDACRRIKAEPGLLDLPPRLSLFGLTRLPASYLEVLEAIGKARQVHLFLMHPSPVLWERMAASIGPASRSVPRREDQTVGIPRNPLLASWGRDAREMQLVLGGSGSSEADAESGPEPESGPGPGDRTLLQQIQEDIRTDRTPGGPGDADERPLLRSSDDSIRVHSCHGRGRQVEVLRDAVLHLLEDDPTLEPRDIIVLCPDIENFAPLIQATFGAHDLSEHSDHPAAALEIRLADRSLRQTNPVMGVLAEVLDLATARISATQVLDLAGREPVRRRFQFSDEDLFRLEEWVDEAGIRWGFDAEHRGEFKLNGIENNTWRSGMERILLGVTMADERQRLFHGALPLDDVDSADIELAGRLAEFVDRLQAALDALSGSGPIDSWAQRLAFIADALTTTTARDGWQRAQMTLLLEDLVTEATTESGVSAVALRCDDVRSIVAARLKGQPTRANFCTGHLTVCTLVPMRSIPHRVVCLLGLDDGSFPRHLERDGDDLTARNPRVGDRDVRSEDRQLLLDAILAARDHLVVLYSGRDERSNQHRPPAVPVGELLDVIDHTVKTKEGRARDAVVLAHPLQPFDARNYEPGNMVPRSAWSFDALHLAGARAALHPRQSAPPFLGQPLPVRPADQLDLDRLERFLRHPARAFLRERLKISLSEKTRDFEDAIPLDLDPLGQWQVAERVLEARLGGASQDACEAVEMARGGLPPGLLAQPVLEKIAAPVDGLVLAGSSDVTPVSIDIHVDLPGVSRIVGTVAGVRGDTLQSVTYSRLSPAARLLAWLRLLVLTASWPERSFEARTIGRANGRGRTISVATIGPLGPDAPSRLDAATLHLRVLVDLFDRGMCEPLPLYCKTSAAWAGATSGGRDPRQGAIQAWESGWKGHNEDRDPEHELVLGEAVSFATMTALSGPPHADEQAWRLPEETRFGVYAHRLWDALLAHEVVVDQ